MTLEEAHVRMIQSQLVLDHWESQAIVQIAEDTLRVINVELAALDDVARAQPRCHAGVALLMREWLAFRQRTRTKCNLSIIR